MITQLDRDTLRREIMEDNWRDAQIEIKMRNDDDFFYDALVDEFGDTVSDLGVAVDNFCMQYDRDVDDWFKILIEK